MFYPNTVVDWAYQDVPFALSYSGAPATVISGFPSFMNGTTVFALADGISCGPFTVSGGAITLPVAASNVVAGYEYFPQLQTLYLDTNAGEGTIQGKRKKITAMTARVKDAAGVNMGTSFQTATRFIPGVSSTDPIQPTSIGGLITGDMRMTMDSLYSVGGQMWIQIDPGLAATIAAVIPEVVLGDS